MDNETNELGRVADGEQALVNEAAAHLHPSGFDPSREVMIQRMILAISSASVRHHGAIAGSMESRSLSYYLGVGIDHFGHNYVRHEVLLRKAAIQALEMAAQGMETGTAETLAAPGDSLTARS